MQTKLHGLLCDLSTSEFCVNFDTKVSLRDMNFFLLYTPSTDASLVISRTLSALVLRASDKDKYQRCVMTFYWLCTMAILKNISLQLWQYRQAVQQSPYTWQRANIPQYGSNKLGW